MVIIMNNNKLYKLKNIRYLIKKDSLITDEILTSYCVNILKEEYHLIPKNYRLFKKSLDARHLDLYYDLSLLFEIDNNIIKGDL